MRFLCLGYLKMDEFDALPESVKSEILTECNALGVPFRATGKIVLEEGVQHHSKVVSIRPTGHGPVVTSAPFIASEYQIGGVFVVEAGDMDEAIQVASLHPAAQLGSEYGFGIEIRPLQ